MNTEKTIIALSPCESCPRAEGVGCHKPVNPEAPTSCKSWEAWFRESWRAVTQRLGRREK